MHVVIIRTQVSLCVSDLMHSYSITKHASGFTSNQHCLESALLCCTFLKDELTHTHGSLENIVFFFPSVRLVFLCSRRQQNLPAVPGDTAELTGPSRCRWVGDSALLFQSAGVRSPVAQPRWNYRRRCASAIVTLNSERTNWAGSLCCSPAAKKKKRSSAVCCTLLLFRFIGKQAS